MHALLLEHVTGQACSHIVAVGRLERTPGLKHTGKDNYAWLFKGETIFCLASGPSLMAEICQRVRGRRSIAINLSAVLAPWASVLFFTDSGWYEPRRQLVANWDGLAIAVCTDAALLTGLPAGDAGGELWSLAQNDNLVAGATFFDLFGYANASQSDARTIGRIATPVYGRTVFGTGGGNVSVGGTTLFSGRRVIRGAYSSAGTVLFMDGAQEGSLPGTPATAAARVALFARALATPSNYWTGIGAAFLITKPLSATKPAVLASYLMSRRNP
ncbi:hypothetical protein [Bradyrhizobium sp. 145]|uniref:hypothetical protein n=1 Tax=Bradyrhizobium sp. 145 TaxID=2782621 RepID=UPI001FFA7682|nr:hypothetical protein [Bradyrhizobium sp. 145]MCK1686617.1 hypothetical protein [Bradyrhizobium sp. 145]